MFDKCALLAATHIGGTSSVPALPLASSASSPGSAGLRARGMKGRKESLQARQARCESEITASREEKRQSDDLDVAGL